MALALAVFAPALLIGFVVASAASDLGEDCATDSEPAASASQGCEQSAPGEHADPYVGGGGLVDDPTSSGRITGRMHHVYAEVMRVFAWPWGVGCWDLHAWNPNSDHPRGRACDFTVGVLGQLPDDRERAEGWKLANWLRAEAQPLGISYVIFDGRIWSASGGSRGWRPYSGGGVYDPGDVTGGHFDHVHVSVVGSLQ